MGLNKILDMLGLGGDSDEGESKDHEKHEEDEKHEE